MSNDKKFKIYKTNSPYSIITNKVSQNLNYNLAALGLFVYIYSLPNDWEFHKSHLQKVCCIGIKKLNSLLKILELHNLITVAQVRDAHGKFAHFSMSVAHCEEFKCIGNNNLEEDAQPYVKNRPTVTVATVKRTYKVNINKVIKEKENTKSIRASTDAHNRFDEFWETYPKKKDKSRAYKIWIKNKLDEKADEIISKVIIQTLHDVQWKDKQFIPHPSSYLNGKLWEDEILAPASTHNKPVNKSEIRQTTQFWEPGNPDYDRVNGVKEKINYTNH